MIRVGSLIKLGNSSYTNPNWRGKIGGVVEVMSNYSFRAYFPEKQRMAVINHMVNFGHEVTEIE